MPTFRPPLGHTSAATVPSSAGADAERQPYLQLNFLAELAPNEHVDGVYELWADIADLDASGHSLAAAGEWHAIPYEQKEEGGERYLLARPVVHASEGKFAYTLRLVKGNGEVVWLGSGGDNGVVEVKEGGIASGDKEKLSVTSAWEGKVDGGEGLKWTGIAASLQQDGCVPLDLLGAWGKRITRG